MYFDNLSRFILFLFLLLHKNRSLKNRIKCNLTCSLVSCTFLPLSTLLWSRWRSWLTSSLVANSFFACWDSFNSVSTCFSTRCSVSAFSCWVYIKYQFYILKYSLNWNLCKTFDSQRKTGLYTTLLHKQSL